MTTSAPAANSPALPPNHHAHFPGFAGLRGLLLALTFSFGRTSDADLAIDLTGAGPGDDVVDVGCGPGTAVRRAAARGVSTVVGVDPAPVMLRVARAWQLASRRRSAARFLEGTAERLPLRDGSASVVWSVATVHHWRDLDTGLAEVDRVLRPSGRFLAVERLTVPGATGHASHGWTEAQARQFADRCRAAGFGRVELSEHQTSRGRMIAVIARRGR